MAFPAAHDGLQEKQAAPPAGATTTGAGCGAASPALRPTAHMPTDPTTLANASGSRMERDRQAPTTAASSVRDIRAWSPASSVTAGVGGVERLERRAAEDAAINDRRLQQQAELGGAVNPPAPDAAAEGVEVFGMFTHQQGLRLAVAALLLEVSARRSSAGSARQRPPR